MGFSYDTSKQFFECFMKHYLKTEDEDRIREVSEKASLLGYSRLIRKYRKNGSVPDKYRDRIKEIISVIGDIANRLDTLAF